MNHVEFDGWEYIGVRSHDREPTFGCCCYKHNSEAALTVVMRHSAYYRERKDHFFVVTEECMLEHLLMEG